MAERWKADAEQIERVSRVESWLSKNPARLEGWSKSLADDQPGQVPGWLREAPFAEDWQRHIADAYLFPADIQQFGNPRLDLGGSDDRLLHARTQYWLLRRSFERVDQPYGFTLGLQRLSWMLENPAHEVERPWSALNAELAADLSNDAQRVAAAMRNFSSRTGNPFLTPDPAELIEVLPTLVATSEQAQQLSSVLRKGGKRLFPTFTPAKGVEVHSVQYPQSALFHWYAFEHGWCVVEKCWEFGLFDEACARDLLKVSALGDVSILSFLLAAPDASLTAAADASAATNMDAAAMRQVAESWLLELLSSGAEIDQDRWCAISRNVAEGVDFPPLPSNRLLLAVAEKLSGWKDRPHGVDMRSTFYLCQSNQRLRYNAALLLWLGKIGCPDTSGTDEALIASLKRFDPDLLALLLFNCPAFTSPLMRALDIAPAHGLFRWLRDLESHPALFDRRELDDLLSESGKSGVKLLEIMKRGKALPEVYKAVKAAMAPPDAKLIASAEKSAQAQLRMLGLAKLVDDDDLLFRFDLLKRAIASSRKNFGAARAANVREAAEDGLSNLACNAGCDDLTQLEWSVASRRSAKAATPVWHWQVDDYALRIEIAENGVLLNLSRDGKPLKSVPAAIKKNPQVADLMAEHAQLKADSVRFRVALEAMMISQSPLPANLQAYLLTSPLTRHLLTGLLLANGAGRVGLLDAESDRLLSLEGQPIELDAVLRVVHPLQLLADNSLAAWQEALFARGMVQPFRQLFRECYVPTPAEIESGDESARFAGREVNTRRASAIFSARGWKVGEGNWGWHATKRLAPGMVARIGLPEVNHFLTELETTVLGAVDVIANRARLALSDAPAIAFSEFMRDLDLVITAAAANQASSAETIRYRAQLLSALMRALRVPNVTIEAPHALIQGNLSGYRVHLGTGVIHAQPAGYLCIVKAEDVPPQQGVAAVCRSRRSGERDHQQDSSLGPGSQDQEPAHLGADRA